MRVRVARIRGRRRAAKAKDRRKERGMKARKRRGGRRRRGGRGAEEPKAAGLKHERMGPCRKKWRRNDGGEERRAGGTAVGVNEVWSGGFKARLCDIKLPEWGVTKEVGEGCTLVDWAATSNVPWTHVLVATLWLEARWALQPLTSKHKLSPPSPSLSPRLPSSVSPSSISETHSHPACKVPQ